MLNVSRVSSQLKQALGLLIAGPCSAESRVQVLSVAKLLQQDGRVAYFRAGVWKPRTRPGQFEGLGTTALPWLREIQETTGLTVCIEVARKEHVWEAVAHGIRAFWIGARTTSDPFAVQEIADALPVDTEVVLVKNPISPDLELWIGAIERIAAQTSSEVIAVHRGFFSIREGLYRNAQNWDIPLQLRTRFGNNLRILCDPSHIAGKREFVANIAQQALDYALDGLMVEIHPTPETALSDARQQLTPAAFFQMLDQLQPLQKNLELTDNEQLANFRKQIDAIDAKILDLLSERAEVVCKIGEWKLQHGVQAFHEERWNELLKHHLRYGIERGLDTHYVRQLCELVHTESLKLQAACRHAHRNSETIEE